MDRKIVYLCSPKRTAIGSFEGSLKDCSASYLGGEVLKAIIAESGIPEQKVDQVIMGSVLTAGQGQAPARQASFAAGLPNHVQAMTINKVCSSGLKAVMLAYESILSGSADAVLAGGMESMSNAPYYLPKLRSGARLGHAQAIDGMIADGLWDPYNDFHMGNCAEQCVEKYGFSREAQDSFAIESYQRAVKANSQGYFREQIVPLTIKVKKEELVFSEDEEPKKVKLEKIPTLRPAFVKDGTVTAANSSSINDGAAGVLVCSEEFLKENKLEPFARIVAQGWAAQAPEWFTTAPVSAVNHLLEATGKSVTDIDLFEINEAFSAVALACSKELAIDQNKLNIDGGAVALGHPIGASGARILVTLLYALKRTKKKTGIAAICNGGGEATALLVESVG